MTISINASISTSFDSPCADQTPSSLEINELLIITWRHNVEWLDMSSNNQRICDALRDFWTRRHPKGHDSHKTQAEWEEERQRQEWFDRPLQPQLVAGTGSTTMPNLILYFGASFNPPHAAHGDVIRTVYEACQYVMQSRKAGLNPADTNHDQRYMNMNLAGATISCSRAGDLMEKVQSQKGRHTIEVKPLSGHERLELWNRGTPLDPFSISSFMSLDRIEYADANLPRAAGRRSDLGYCLWHGRLG